jgi:RsiW-degrading membrane proteinase PrsW (M82 family)
MTYNSHKSRFLGGAAVGKRWLVMNLLIAVFLACAVPAFASAPLPEDDLELARRYAPVFTFHPDEVFRPQPVEVIVEQARLRQSRRLWFDANVLLSLDVPDLLGLESDRGHFLDVWYGDSGSSAYTNYSAHRLYYEAALSPKAGGPPVTVYAHVVRDEVPGAVTIQYWAFYFYNDWFNKHEGDWEMVQVILTDAGEPQWVVLSQHHGGTRRTWAQAPVEEDTRPVAYVALGSHANYFVGNEVYPNGKDVGNTRVEIMDRTGYAGRAIPEVIMIPDRVEVIADAVSWPGAEWLPFRGHWGELAAQSDFGGPLGPADKGEQWESPYAWGMAQPLDAETWYANRLRVEVIGAATEEMEIRLTDTDSRTLLEAQMLGNVAILHADPPPAGARAEINAPSGATYDVLARWPQVAEGQVIEMRFDDVRFAGAGQAVLAFAPDGEASLTLQGAGSALEPTETETVEATWDAPDLVWIGGILPAHHVVSGVILAILAAVVPSSIYIGVLYWVDRYEKEPKRLLAAAFLWGAIPAVLLALVVELFFSLPPDLIGPQALEAVRLGLVAPLLQEALKGLVVLFIAWRYRREFDNVLDGLIYGALAGFGFAMTGNLLSYVGSFLLWGFSGLSGMAIVEGIVYALDSALYSAIFGAGLGLGRLARVRWRRWAFPVGGFLLAVVVHALHSVLAYRLLALSAITVLSTAVGVTLIVIVAVWSLRRQQRCLREELRGLVPDDVYHVMVTPGARTWAQWRALRRGGVRAWWQTRRLHQLCAELAFKRVQARLCPDEVKIAAEAKQLREKVEEFL